MRAGKPVGKAFLTAAVLVVLTLSLGGTSASKGVDRTATYEQLKLFTDVLSIIQNQYVDETEPKEVIYGARSRACCARSTRTPRSWIPRATGRCRSRPRAASAASASRSRCRDDVLTVVAPIDGTPA